MLKGLIDILPTYVTDPTSGIVTSLSPEDKLNLASEIAALIKDEILQWLTIVPGMERPEDILNEEEIKEVISNIFEQSKESFSFYGLEMNDVIDFLNKEIDYEAYIAKYGKEFPIKNTMNAGEIFQQNPNLYKEFEKKSVTDNNPFCYCDEDKKIIKQLSKEHRKKKKKGKQKLEEEQLDNLPQEKERFFNNQIDLEHYNSKYGDKYPVSKKLLVSDIFTQHPEFLYQFFKNHEINACMDGIIVCSNDDIQIMRELYNHDQKIKDIKKHLVCLQRERIGTKTLQHQVYRGIGLLTMFSNTIPIFPDKDNINVLWGMLYLNASTFLFQRINDLNKNISISCAVSAAIYDYFHKEVQNSYVFGLIKKETNEMGEQKYNAARSLDLASYMVALTWDKLFSRTNTSKESYHDYKMAQLSIFMNASFMILLERIKQEELSQNKQILNIQELFFKPEFVRKITDEFANKLEELTYKNLNPAGYLKGYNPFIHRSIKEIAEPSTWILIILDNIKELGIDNSFDYDDKGTLKAAIKSLKQTAISKTCYNGLMKKAEFSYIDHTFAQDHYMQTILGNIISNIFTATREQWGQGKYKQKTLRVAKNNSLGALPVISLYAVNLPEWYNYIQWSLPLLFGGVFERLRVYFSNLTETQEGMCKKVNLTLVELIARNYIFFPNDVLLEELSESDAVQHRSFQMLKHLTSTMLYKSCDFLNMDKVDQAMLGKYVFVETAQALMEYEPDKFNHIQTTELNKIADNIVARFLSSVVSPACCTGNANVDFSLLKNGVLTKMVNEEIRPLLTPDTTLNISQREIEQLPEYSGSHVFDILKKESKRMKNSEDTVKLIVQRK